MKVLVTGGTGFIGANLVKELVRRGDLVNVLCRHSANAAVLGMKGVHVHRGDLTLEEIVPAMNGCDAVFHLAAYARTWSKDPAEFHRVNVGGTRAVLEAARECGAARTVFTSSNLTLGPSNGSITDEGSSRAVPFFTEYERSKAEAEQIVMERVSDGMDIVVVNPTRVFGPGLMNEGNSVTRLIEMYLRGRMRVILGNGTVRGNYAFVRDVVRGHILALEQGRTGEKYILGGSNASFNDFFTMLSDITSRSYRMVHVPEAVAMGFARYEEFRARWFGHYPLITRQWLRLFAEDWACSTEKAEREIGYRVTPLREALETTVAWLREEVRWH